MQKKEFDAVVIGGGPAGMMAAGRAAERRRETLLLEGNDIPGRKLLISGKGRCNITNSGSIDDHLENFGKTGQFLRNAFSVMFNTELTEFFESKGVVLTVERGRRGFPESGRSKDILEALKRYLSENGAKVLLQSKVENVIVENSGKKRVVLSEGAEYLAGTVAICTGGLSYPETGSKGFGFKIAKKLGHNVVPYSPALIPVITESRTPKTWQGISLKNVEAAVICGGRKGQARFGDALFTHFGLSGPIILDLSAEIHRLVESGKEAHISINLKPAIDKNKLDKRLVREFSRHSNKVLKNVLRELLPVKMIGGFLKLCELSPDAKANQVTKDERARIIEKLTDLRFKIKGTRPIEEAIVTRGGVDIKEINPKTMESKLIKGLFFAGEVIDVDAGTGGYNMQAAFSTGYVCGDNI